MLPFPSSVKYINRRRRPERIFACRLVDRMLIDVTPNSSGDQTDMLRLWGVYAPLD